MREITEECSNGDNPEMYDISVWRLGVTDEKLAQQTFLTMAEVFNEDSAPLGASYLKCLLSRNDFFAFAALAGEEVVGGITAVSLPLTRLERRELFIYDLAVKREWQRKGIGRALFESLRQAAADQGIGEGFVLADNEDTDALRFYRGVGASASPVTAFSFSTLNH
jgi:aminoglycoside 3-N-acetyltransferase I